MGGRYAVAYREGPTGQGPVANGQGLSSGLGPESSGLSHGFLAAGAAGFLDTSVGAAAAARYGLAYNPVLAAFFAGILLGNLLYDLMKWYQLRAPGNLLDYGYMLCGDSDGHGPTVGPLTCGGTVPWPLAPPNPTGGMSWTGEPNPAGTAAIVTGSWVRTSPGTATPPFDYVAPQFEMPPKPILPAEWADPLPDPVADPSYSPRYNPTVRHGIQEYVILRTMSETSTSPYDWPSPNGNPLPWFHPVYNPYWYFPWSQPAPDALPQFERTTGPGPSIEMNPDYYPTPTPRPGEETRPGPVPAPSPDVIARPDASTKPGAQPSPGPVPAPSPTPSPVPNPWPYPKPQTQLDRTNPTRTRKTTKEIKKASAGRVILRRIVGPLTEAGDALKCAWKALPKDAQEHKVKSPRWYDSATGKWHRKVLTDAKGRPLTTPRPQDMVRDLAKHADKMDVQKFAQCQAQDMITDAIIGRTAKGAQKPFGKVVRPGEFGLGSGPAL